MNRVVIALPAIGLLSPASLLAQTSDTHRVQASAVSWVLNRLPEVSFDSVLRHGTLQSPAPRQSIILAACVSVAPPRLLGGRPSPMVRSGDVDSLTLSAISANRRPVKPGSACGTDREWPVRVIETASGRQALAITVSIPEFTELDRATVYVDYRVQALWAGGYECVVIRQKEAWAVASCRPTWVS
jgi:hypothetical protein